MAGNLNRVIITGNLTRDPEMRTLPSGTSVCELRVACNGRRRNADGGWEDDPNYFNVSVWGAQGENCKRYLFKGRGVAIDGRLRWREWETDGQKRQAVDIIAETVQFLGGGGDAPSGNGNGFSSSVSTAASDIPVDTADFVPAAVGSGVADDDIPF
ncbi:MAG: single-stranded DNA-binding protein [Actinomycetota bacterium]|nr:single-stranded DNA-binding protein [Actinomycetota bacterium]